MQLNMLLYGEIEQCIYKVKNVRLGLILRCSEPYVFVKVAFVVRCVHHQWFTVYQNKAHK